MEKNERELRKVLNRCGYVLRRQESGYQIGDKKTNTIYLGKSFDAALEDVAKFVEHMDERGYSDPAPFREGNEERLDEEYIEDLNIEITNLSRYRETLLQAGKYPQAEELTEKIRELEEMLADAEEEDALAKKLRSYLETEGYRLEPGIDGYRIANMSTGEICLGRQYDAELEDAAEFAKSLGWR